MGDAKVAKTKLPSHAIALARGDTSALTAWLRAGGEGCKAEGTQGRCTVLVAALLSEKRGEASAGSDSNCKTQDENPKPHPTPSIHPQQPQLPAPCSCCWAPRGSTSPTAKICPWRAPSTGGLGAGVMATGGTATEAAPLSHRALQSPRGPKTCACCSGGLS